MGDEERLRALEELEAHLHAMEQEIASSYPPSFKMLEEHLTVLEKALEGVKAGHDASLDAKALIEYEEDEAVAYITVTAPKLGGRQIEKEEVLRKIKEEGIINPDTSVVERIFSKRLFGQRLLLAKGKVPTKGENGYFLYRWGVDEHGEMMESNLRKVAPGQVLFYKVRAKAGEAGKSVKGKVIPARLGAEPAVQAGFGVALVEDGQMGIATRDGEVFWEADRVSVEKVYRISGDLDELAEDIKCKERVHIMGSVMDGKSVETESSVVIEGELGAASIKSGGKVVVKEQIMGKKKASIAAAADIFIKRAEEAIIKSEGSIVVQEDIINCTLEAKADVIVKGAIVGGRVSARMIEAGSVGKEKGGVTSLSAKKICIKEDVFAGTKLFVEGLLHQIKKVEKQCCFFVEGGKVVQEAFEPLRFEEKSLPSPKEEIPEVPLSVAFHKMEMEEASKIASIILGTDELECIEEEELFYLHKKGEVPPQMEEEIVDGSFKFTNTERGLYLTVFAPKGGGEPVKVEQVKEQIEKEGFVQIDEAAVLEAISKAEGVPLQIGPRQYIEGLDGQVLVEISSDGRSATATIVPPKPGGLPLRAEDVVRILQQKGIVAGIKEEQIKKAMAEGKFNTPFVVAEEVPPQPYEETKIEFLFPKEQSVQFVEDEHGRIDFKELGILQNVAKGQVLAIKVKSKEKGKEGKKITGEPIPPPPAPEPEFPAGKNTAISEDGTKLLATCDGQLVWYANKMNVEPIYEIKGDVCMETGNVDFLGTILVQGDIRDGFRVRAEGNVQVKGGIGAAQVNAGGSILCGTGIRGKGEARIYAGGDIVCKFIENAYIFAKGNVIVQEEILHSVVDAGGKVEVLGKRGAIIGGKVRADEEIVAKQIGCGVDTHTYVEVGVKPKVREQLEALDELIEKEHKKLERIKLDLNTLRDWKREGKLSASRQQMLEQLASSYNVLVMKLRSYRERKEILEAQIAKSLHGKISATDIIYPGVTVTVRAASLFVKEKMQGVNFRFEDNEVRVASYTG